MDTDSLHDYLKSMEEYSRKEPIHMVTIDLIYEKPIASDMNNMISDGLRHEYDQLIDIFSKCDSFSEANIQARKLWT